MTTTPGPFPVTPVPVPIPLGISSNERKAANLDTRFTPKLKTTGPAPAPAPESFAPPLQQTAEEKEIQKSFIQGSMTGEVQERLKASPELRRSILGIPVSLKAQEAVVKGQMSSDLRSLLINEVNTIQKSRPNVSEAKPAVQSTPTSIPPMGNLNSAEPRTIDTVKMHDEETANGTNSSTALEQFDIRPPKRVLTAKRSNRPERPTPSASQVTRISDKVRLSSHSRHSHSLKPDRARDPRNPISPARITSDISAVPSDKDMTSRKSAGYNTTMQESAEVHDNSLDHLRKKASSLEKRESFFESPRDLKRKRDSSHALAKDLTPGLGHSSSPSDPSREQKGRSKPMFDSASKTGLSGLSPIPDTSNSMKRSSSGRFTKVASPVISDKPTQRKGRVNLVDTEDDSMEDFDEFPLQGIPMGSNSSDEDYSIGNNGDTEGDGDGDSIVLGDEGGLEEESMSKRQSRTKSIDAKPHDYFSWKLESGEMMRTAGATLPLEYQNYDDPDYPWICPIRSCRALLASLPGLGSHFNRKHRRANLNDNEDGTLSIVSLQDDDGVKPAVVISRGPLDPNEPPMAQPAVPSQTKQRTEARLSQLRSDSPNSMKHIPAKRLATTRSTGDKMALWEYIHPYLKNTPFSPITHLGHVPEMLGLPRVRDVKLNKMAQNPYSEARAQDIAALIIQVTGDKSPRPCSRCQAGKGPFEGCYVISTQAPLATRQLITGCANCLYKCNHTHCDLKSWSRETYPELTEPQPKEHTSSTQQPAQREPKRSSTEKMYPARRSERVVVQESIAESSAAPHHDEANDEESEEEIKHSTARVTKQPRVKASLNTQVSVQDEVVRFANPPEIIADPAQQWELESWEIAPGRIRNAKNENVIFSTTYLSQGQAVAVAAGVAFQVITIKPGTMHTWRDMGYKQRICSVATGKVKVKMDGEETTVGPHGMFVVGPGTECTAMNLLYVDSIIHACVNDI